MAKKPTVPVREKAAPVKAPVPTPEVESDEEVDDVRAEDSQAKTAEIDAYDILVGEKYVRTYSQEVHGDDFKALAEGFITKKFKGGAYSMVPSHTIAEVEVRYREKEDAELPLDKQNPDKPFIDKSRKFGDKEAALSFKSNKYGASIVVVKKK